MPELNFLTIILLAALLGVIIFIGRELEERYPEYADYAVKGTPTTIVQQLRAGTFVVLDYASEVAFPGSRNKAIQYKKDRKIANA
jgi:hypothetical protein